MSKSTTKVASAASAAAAMTTPAQLERLGGHLRKLRLLKSGERLEALLQHAAANDLPYAEFLEQVLGEEVAAKTSKNIAMRTAMARFPFVKPLETFDFDYQPSIDRKQVQQLASCHFIEHGDNVIVLGPPGVGKTHLAVSLGLKAIEAGYRVLFTTAATLIEKLTKAHTEGRLEEKLKLYTAPRLLVVDEIGYLPIDLGHELGAAELAALVGVDDLRRSPARRRLAQGLDAEVRLHRDRHPVRQHPSAGPVQHRHQVHPATRHRDVGDVQRPDLVGALDGQPAQRVREHRVRRVLLARVGLAVQRLDAHAPHQRAHVPPADLDALQAQQVAQHAAAGERVLQVQLVDAAHQRQLGLGDRLGVVVHRAPADAQQLACRLIGSSASRSIIALRSAIPPW
jgi:hypothetical protein